jgi:XTP/dITP diphosphohydrolase
VDAEPWADTGTSRLFEGRWDVELRVARRGTGGFGYDPHAWLVGRPADPEAGRGPHRTVAELLPAEKAALSHRGHALRALLAWLASA